MEMPWDGNGGWLGSRLLGAKQKGKKREKEERERERKWRGFVNCGR